MSRRNTRAAPAKLKLGKSIHDSTPIGWSFYSLFTKCRYAWFQKYVEGIEPVRKSDYYILGATYHLLHEGKTDREIAAQGVEFAEQLPEARRLYEARLANTEHPLPRAKGSEVPYEVKRGPLKGIYTVRLDRLEVGERGQLVGREWKTAAYMRATDEDYYAVYGEVLGELIASGLRYVTVDIVSKAKEPKVAEHRISLVGGLEDPRAKSFMNFITWLATEIRDAMSKYAASEHALGHAAGPNRLLHSFFPQNHLSCVQGGTECEYYSRCWGHGATEHLYQKKERTEWAKHLL